MLQTWVHWTITITIPLDVYFYIIFLFLLNFSPSSSTCYSLCYAIVIVHFGHTSSCFSLKIPKHHFRHSVAFCVCTISISYLHTMLSRVSGWLSVCLSVRECFSYPGVTIWQAFRPRYARPFDLAATLAENPTYLH